VSKGLAVITGASAGIGAAFARRLAAEGYDLLLIARRADRLAEIAAELRAVSVEPFVADLTHDADLRRAEAAIASRPNLQLLVNNAGFGLGGRFFETSADDHERMHKLHVIATMRLSHAALKRMAVADSGAVINVSSVAGFTVSPGGVSYSATKNWMNVFTEGLWLDLKTRRSHVKVQALCPGFTYSEFHDVMKMDRKLIPKSMWTPAEAVVDAALRGLESDTLFVVPGWRYKLLVAMLKVAPRSLIRAGSVRMARRLKRTV
jgi:short-subunit dehydrogenase